MQSADYLQLPDRIDLVQRVDLSEKAITAYQDFEKTLLSTLPDGEEVEAVNAAVLAGKLLQYANGAVYTDEQRNWSLAHDAKIDALAEILEANEGRISLLPTILRAT